MKIRNHAGGHQVTYRFNNNYGASVVKHDHSYGLELAVIYYPERGDDFKLVYDTPITSDVLGHQSDDEIAITLSRIATLPERGA